MYRKAIQWMIVGCLLLPYIQIQAQAVTIKEELISLPTYDFGKGNPVPILAENPKIFPYFKFEEYEHVSKRKNWKVVTLENDYIKVMVLPEIGGKVWGAIEKSTGEEFLYKNEVIKFRNIAMRGPWTSGGIEFNFGIIGHHPSTATPVDYLTRTNPDGSVSCIVSNLDLSSNTRWTVEIRLEKDKAYFETNASWYNASPLTESYYNWMTAAAVATDDLEFFIPGNAYVEHNGDAHPWPIDEQGRNLAMYKENNFGPAKSYHVVGEYNDFFGGYYHDRKFGFGQWSPYEEMPGQKLWLWALSRSGGIWEDLLTDTDGQYIEFQAGRLFDQYFPGATNPISQVGFDPYMMDRWSEIWFPIKEIGGMEDASEHGVLNVEIESGVATIGINALQKLDTELRIVLNGETTVKNLVLQPMEVSMTKLPVNATDKIDIFVDGTELSYSNNSEANHIKRPFYPNKDLKVSLSEQLLFEGTEALEYREFELAHQKLSELIEIDPLHQTGLVKLAELEFRRTNYDTALEHANSVLRMDTYHSGANYITGITYRAKSDVINALESLGWAARDIKYRSVAYAQMAEINLQQKNYGRAKTYASKAIDFNTYNINARESLLMVHSESKDEEGFKKELQKILEMDPMNHFVQLQSDDAGVEKRIHNEFKAETILGLALRYLELGFAEEALSSLSIGNTSQKNELWKAYLLRNSKIEESSRILNKTLQGTVNFVSPYRRKTVPVLEWAISQNTDWKLKYYLAQNYIAVGLKDKGKDILKELGTIPNSDVFYRFRAKMNSEASFEDKSEDYKKALALNPKDWKVWEENIQFYSGSKKYNLAHNLSQKAYRTFKGNYNIGLAHAKSLLNTGQFEKTLAVLETIQVLPYEHASESRNIYERAHLGVALDLMKKKKYNKAISILNKSKEWPENIGVGKPYQSDERAQDYLLAISYSAINQDIKKEELLNDIVEYTNKNIMLSDTNHLFGLLALKKLGKQTEVEKLLQILESSTEEKDFKNRLVLAFFKKNKEESTKLKAKNIVSNDVWQTLVTSSSY
jgi:predicted Zn-dependent protease